MKKFEVGKSYQGTFDIGGTFTFKVTKRTEKSVWLQDDCFYKEPTRKKIIQSDHEEWTQVMSSKQYLGAGREV